jgi:hypothetical protein
MDPKFNTKDGVQSAVSAKYELCDEVNDLTIEDNPDHHAISERQMVDTILAFLPNIDFWENTRSYFDSNPDNKNRKELTRKVKHKVEQAKLESQGSCSALEEANATKFQPNLRNHKKNYRDPYYLSSIQYNQILSGEDKLKILKDYLKTLTVAPRLGAEDFKKFLIYAKAHQIEAKVAVDLVYEAEAEATMHADPETLHTDAKEGYVHPKLIKAALTALTEKRQQEHEATHAGLDNDSSDESIDVGGAVEAHDADDGDLGSD